MIVVTAFSNSPALDHQKQPTKFSHCDLANKWFDWCAELGGVSDTELVVLAPRGYPIPPSAEAAWKKVTVFPDKEQARGWPQGPNSCFKQLAWILLYRKPQEPWLFCEPDCIPLRSGWVAEISQAYARANKPFMGVLESGGMGPSGLTYPSHMAGNGVYPANAAKVAADLVNEHKSNVAFDIRGAAQVVPQMAKTDLICQRYRRPAFRSLEEFRAEVPRQAVLFHSDKYGALINLLSSQSADGGKVETPVPAQAVEPEAPKPERLRANGLAPVLSHAELCEAITANVKSETARTKLMIYLHEHHFHQKNFGAAIKELALNAG